MVDEMWGVYVEYFGGNWAPSQYKDRLSRYEDLHYNNKLVVRPSYLYSGNPYTGKMIFVY